MNYIVLNALQILIAIMAGLGLGALYTLAGRTRALTTGIVVTVCVAEGWIACILAGALILAPVKAGGWTIALGTAVIIWSGFVLPALAATLRYRGAGWRETAGDCAHWLGVMLVQAAVLHALGLTHP